MSRPLLTGQTMSAETTLKKERPFWRKFFSLPSARSLARTALVSLAVLSGVKLVLPSFLSARPLSEGETQMLQEVFGKALDADKVGLNASNVMDYRHTFLGTAAEQLGNKISFHSEQMRADFSKAGAVDRNLFLHEATHLWQSQNCSVLSLTDAVKNLYARTKGYAEEKAQGSKDAYMKAIDGIYEYKLDPAKDLLDYNIEQQANIVADYFVYAKDGRLPMMAKGTTQEYEAVLKNFLKDPSYLSKNCFRF